MGKAYSPEQRDHVRQLLESGRDEEWIEKETGVSDRTIRRWKLELERTGRIGKPPEARTGRHRVLNAEVEQALFNHAKDKPDMSVDDMLWWLYDQYKLVVGTRTIRRVFERKGDKVKKSKSARKNEAAGDDDDDGDDDDHTIMDNTPAQPSNHYQSPYAPMAPQPPNTAEQQLAHAFQQQQQHTPQQQQQHFAPPPSMTVDDDLPDDEETIQLQLQQIELQKRELELKLKMRRLQQNNASSAKSTPVNSRTAPAPAPSPGRKPSGTSSLYNPNAPVPTAPKRDSRSKKKIEESKRRTAERQERMLRDLERRSRRRDHLTAEWVTSKDIWPLRAQGMLADLMHQYACYAFSQNHSETFENMYRELYQLVDLQKGDWVPQVHDEMLRERMKRKMGQLRTKMQKTGEIVTRTDGYGGFIKADNFTGEQAGGALDDESELMTEMSGHEMQGHEMQGHTDMQQAQPGAPPMQEEQIHYEPVPDHQQMAAQAMPYGMLANQGQYPMMNQIQDQIHGLPAYHMNGQMGAQMNGNQGVMGL